MIESGTILQSRYRVQRQIGEGGMGAVYIATDERFGSTVAIKETFFADNALAKAFEREARLLNNLRHPALPRVSDHFIDPTHGQFLVMEYIAGEDLSEMMARREGAFPVTDVVNWADQLLDALDYLHTQDVPVVHRDIKPQNLKLTPRGQIILLDFGLAKGNPTDAQHQTAAKSVFGYSRYYASLEQIQGTGTDPRSDLYSLAATIYHLLTGRPPVDALTRAMKVLNGEPDPLIPAHKVNSLVNVGLAEFLGSAMALNANNRPESAAEMRVSLKTSLHSNGSDLKTTVEQAADTGILAEKTKILSQEKITDEGVTPFGTLPDSENTRATEIKPAAVRGPNLVVPVTKPVDPVITGGNSGNVKSSRKGVFAAIAGAVVLIGAGTSAVYVARTGGFSGISNTSNSADNSRPQAGNNSVPLADVPPVLSSNSNIGVSANSVDPVVKLPVASSDKPDQPRQDVKPAVETEAKQNAPEPAPDRTLAPPKPSPSQERTVIIVPKPTVAPDTAVPAVPEKPAFPKTPVFTEEQLRRLTPEQRRKLRIMMERQRRRENTTVQPPTP